MPKEAFLDSHGVKLYYIDWGGTGRPMMLLAGLGDTAHQYRGLAVLAEYSHPLRSAPR